MVHHSAAALLGSLSLLLEDIVVPADENVSGNLLHGRFLTHPELVDISVSQRCEVIVVGLRYFSAAFPDRRLD